MFAAAVMCVLWPLARRSKGIVQADTPQIAFFKEQLSAVDERLASSETVDQDRSVLEAERTEIARRLLRAVKSDLSRDAGGHAEDGWLFGRRVAAMVALCVVPSVALITYTTVGSPGLRDEPLSARISPNLENRSIEEMVAIAEKHLAANPDDLKGWTVLMTTYKRLGRAPDVARVTQQVMRLDGRKPVHLADLAEALTVANGNIVPERASKLLDEVLATDPNMPKAVFYAALAFEQEDKKPQALKLWQRAVSLRQEDSRWQAAVRARIAAIDPSALPAEAQAKTPAAAPVGGPLRNPPRGPDREDVEAASRMSAEDRNAMIKGMVSGLASRLAENPDDLQGWQQLVRSYAVLRKIDEARKALAVAREQFAQNADAQKALDLLEERLQLKREN